MADVQVNFSGGQVNASAKRRQDLELVATGARQMVNWRVEPTGTLAQRPGRRVLYPVRGHRAEYVRMTPNDEFQLVFSANTISLYSLDGTSSVSSAGYPWGEDVTIDQIVWAQAVYDIVICYRAQHPLVCRWNPVTKVWTFFNYAFRVVAAQVMEPFIRVSVPGATMTPSSFNATPSINLFCSQPYFNVAMVGAVLSILGQQVTIQAVIDTQNATVGISYRLAPWVRIPVSDTSPFQVGQIVAISGQNFKMEVGTVNAAGGFVSGTMTTGILFDPSAYTPATLTSPLGSASMTSGPIAETAPQPTVQWAEEFMSQVQGWPSSVSYDQNRLIFCDFPQRPEAILWCSVGAPDIAWIDPGAAALQPAAGTLATSAILEFIPSKPRVRWVLGKGDEFVFTDRGTFYIPLTPTTGGGSLVPGSVSFKQISADGCAGIRPVVVFDSIVYVNSGLTRLGVVRATGAYTRPYVAEDLSNVYDPLFTGPVQLAIATADGILTERYAYVVNADGSIIQGKFSTGQNGSQIVGWMPWTASGGTPRWVTTSGASVWFTTSYPGGFFVEALDTFYLDGYAILAAPLPAMVKPGMGPLWHLAGATVTVMDGAYDYGDFLVDATGNLVVGQPIVDLSSPTIAAGLYAPAVFEPFVPPVKDAPGRNQRQRRRNVTRTAVVVQQSSGFTLSGRTYYPPAMWGEDPASQVLRETTYRAESLMPVGAMANQGRGTDFDPSIILRRDRPGPFRLCEISFA